MITDVKELFDRQWTCFVVRTGRHNGSGCTESDPHHGWGCSYRWVAPPLTDAEARLLGVGEPDPEPRVLAEGDRLVSNPCDVKVTQLGERAGDTWAWCRVCCAAHCIDRALFEKGRGPWRRSARTLVDNSTP